jgi:Spy/CpxP family protein refolding chaperone
MKLTLAALTVIALSGLAAAQHQHGVPGYAGMQQRSIKALSDQQIADLRAGRGMGLALAGELNGFAGPLHALELADKLMLTDAQRVRMRELYDAMKAEAIPLGETLIAEESTLDRAFAERAISEQRLEALTARIGATQGRLRAVHLKYHLTTDALLSPHQKRQYVELRGYN